LHPKHSQRKPIINTHPSDHGNCALIVDLEFCDQVAYAVPSNPNFGDSTKLAQWYDSYAASMYANFDKSLAQIACEAPPSQRYSLARNCTDCAAAYKDWLCSVTIPRCEDFDTPHDYLQPRAVFQPFPDGSFLTNEQLRAANVRNTTLFNSSRNPLIDEVIRPGPYKEVLPCDNLCYKLVQSCPAALGFSCPRPGDIGFQGNYGLNKTAGGNLTCNFPGSAHFRSEGGRVEVFKWLVVGWAAVVGFVNVVI
jgi:calcium channel MID1